MTAKQLLNELEEIMELDEDSLTPQQSLSELAEWDSMSVLSVIALFDSKLSKPINAAEINGVSKVSDLLSLDGLQM